MFCCPFAKALKIALSPVLVRGSFYAKFGITPLFFLTILFVFNLIYLQNNTTLKQGNHSMFVWIFHRISGLLLILLLGVKFFTSFFLMTKEQKPDWALVLHVNPFLDTLLIISVVFHALYGLRTVVIDLGLRKEKLLFWVATILSLVLSAFLLILYFTRNY
jgi:succinate dehydrogenase/fumarate reductase cytochrome b subunit